MSTLADAMNDATAAENAAVDALNAAAALLQNKAALAEGAIQSFLYRAAQVFWYIDFNTGVDDANHGKTIGAPCKTIDYAISQADLSVINWFLCFTDQTITKGWAAGSGIFVVGALRSPGVFNSPWTYTQRRLSFAAESVDSPYVGGGRQPGYLNLLGSFAIFQSLEVRLPATPDVLDNKTVLRGYGASVSFLNCTVTIEDASKGVSMFESGYGLQSYVGFTNTTLGTGAAGHIFKGIAAGANPNSSVDYRSNLTSA
ncbi:hypothetical protein [Methylobacterium gnaphalii]|uniref:Uncharacterized protein n=1 Tax=Methylobacterium gnaphalii TaxID=1010610 RepID=A0A512JPG4_9HYPH|nr:hypothetical protein [Methylobacterium gnaphalii]GEP11822.1 hypothetical protein MGN01_36670 [Methylobacterium gnaphalii]GJD69406.1 hypothetical protein MMMDOFMJ_2337 [Methylobacterium gnaphalii]GLS49543.1 hypothetical protein GCM10007885_23920 [Methylobacterium gnaphalii]